MVGKKFQNTGNDTAFTVLIIDTLSDFLDLNSFEILSSSHPMLVNNYEGVIWFRFNHINLPDSGTNEMMSHGYVKYRVKLKNNISIGNSVLNTAYIYFDFNEAIVTNTAITTLTTFSSVKDNKTSPLFIYPNPVMDNLSIKSNEQILSIKIFDVTGKIVFSENVNRLFVKEIDIKSLSKGVYHINVITINSVQEQPLIKQ